MEALRRADAEAVADPVELAQAELSAEARPRHPAQALPAISSTSPPMWPGMRPATFSSPTATATARIAKFDKDGKFLKSWGSRGSETGKFNRLTSLATDKQGDVYVADRGNKRIQVFDSNGDFKSQITNVGSPWAICISPGAHQYLYSSNSNEVNSMDNGEIYKLELDGRVVGKFGQAGKLMKQFGTVNEIDCRRANELYVGEVLNWRVQKLTLH